MSTPPDDREIFSLLCSLQILGESDSQKAAVRFEETGRGKPLLEFLCENNYLQTGHAVRLQSMNKSPGGDLSARERATLNAVVAALTEIMSRVAGGAKTTLHTGKGGRSKTVVQQPGKSGPKT